jgi:CBS domain-containing protein
MHATPKRTEELFPERSLRQILAGQRAVVHAVAPDDPASLALQRMAEHDIGLVVVLEGDRLAGVLSERDLGALRRGSAGGAAAAMASGGMDTLPHNGAVVITLLSVSGLTHRQS